MIHALFPEKLTNILKYNLSYIVEEKWENISNFVEICSVVFV